MSFPVGIKSILSSSSANVGQSVLVNCDADLAGVPIELKTLEYLELTWRNESLNLGPLSVDKVYVNTKKVKVCLCFNWLIQL